MLQRTTGQPVVMTRVPAPGSVLEKSFSSANFQALGSQLSNTAAPAQGGTTAPASNAGTGSAAATNQSSTPNK